MNPRLFDDMMIGTLELFCLTAELGSFTAVAHQLGLTPTAVSRGMTRLEARYGAQLLIRSTRQIRLTPAGQAFAVACRQALEQLKQAERQLTDQQQHVAGLVRCSVPTSYGHYRIAALMPALHQRYPQLKLELHFSNHNVDFIQDGYDLAIRAREQPDSNLIMRKLEDAELITVASKRYLARYGTPQTPDDLKQHQCIGFILPSRGTTVAWQFEQQGRLQAVEVGGWLAYRDDILAGVTLAKQGAGVVQIYRFLVEDALADGTLVQVLPQYACGSRPFSLIYPAQRYMSAPVRAVVEFLVEQCRMLSRGV